MGQKYDESFGDNGVMVFESLQNVSTHKGEIYIQNNTLIQKSTDHGRLIKAEIEKYSKNGKVIPNFGNKGKITVQGYSNFPHKTLKVIFKDDHLITPIYESDQHRFEFYSLDGKKTLEVMNPSFKPDFILGVLDEQNILYPTGPYIYTHSASNDEDKVFASAGNIELSMMRSPYEGSSILDNQIYQVIRYLFENRSEYRLSIYNLNGEFISKKLLYTYRKTGEGKAIFIGQINNLNIYECDKHFYYLIPFNVKNHDSSKTPLKLKFIKKNINRLEYLTQSKSGIHYIYESHKSSNYDKRGNPIRGREYIKAYNNLGQLHRKFGDNGVFDVSKSKTQSIYRLNENELIICKYEWIDHLIRVKENEVRYEISKLILE